MISVLAQERLVGFALGSILSGVFIFEERRSVYRLIAQNQPSPPQFQQRFEASLYEKKSRAELSHIWNKAVDQTLSPVIAALSSRGW